jgi:phosphohistidine phosphatase SixA
LIGALSQHKRYRNRLMQINCNYSDVAFEPRTVGFVTALGTNAFHPSSIPALPLLPSLAHSTTHNSPTHNSLARRSPTHTPTHMIYPFSSVLRCLLTFSLAFSATFANAQTEPTQATEAHLWAMLKEGGLVVMMRHAQTTPGVGDPPGYKLGDCAVVGKTQRSLSDAGRAHARAIGEAARKNGVRFDEVRTSQWCRAQETAQLGFGKSVVWSPVSSFFDDRSTEARQSAAVHALAKTVKRPTNVLLVSHGVNTLAVSGRHPAPGEWIVLKPDASGKLVTVGQMMAAQP